MEPRLKSSHSKVVEWTGRKAVARLLGSVRPIGLVLLGAFQPLAEVVLAQVPAAAVVEFDRALSHFRAGTYGAALAVAEPLARRFPQVAEIQHFLAIAFDLNQRPEEANRHFRLAVELEPESVVFRTNLGASLMRLGQASEAASQFRRVLDIDPGHATASFNLGTILLQQSQPEQALPWFEKAYARQPGVYENAYQLAYCRFSLGMYEDAAQVLNGLAGPAASRAEVRLLVALADRALGRGDRVREVLQSIRPMLAGQPQMELQLASLLLSQGLVEECEQLLESAARQMPGSYSAHLRLAVARQELGKLADATLAARAALALHETAEVHLLLGDLLESQGEFLEAVGHFQRAVALDPTPDNYFALGYEFLVHWNWEAAAEVFSAGIELEPGSWRLRIGAGAAALGLTRYEEATTAFLRAVDLDPRQMAGYHLLAQAFDKSEEAFDDAVLCFRELLGREAANPWARYYDALATIRQASRTGDRSGLPERIESLTQLTREDPEFLEAHVLLGELQFELQNWTGAVEALQRAVRLDPSQVTAHYRLGIALQRSGRSQDARTVLQRYNDLKARQDQLVGERVAATTRFIVELHKDREPR